MNPRFPIYIVSKGRADSRLTSRTLEKMRVPYFIVIEEQEYDQYAAVIDPKKIVILDKAYQRNYDALIPLEPGQSRGSGPARNFAWDHSIKLGYPWHWVVDDNIRYFYRLNNNMKIPVADGTIFRIIEDFCLRYVNISMAGPNYAFFAPRKYKIRPLTFNTRIYSCNLIRNDTPFRWRGRYNEDVDLSIRMLKAGWCTVLFKSLLQGKMNTQSMKGGNTDAFYAAEGTFPKTRMLYECHPDITSVVWKWGRWHHVVDYSSFSKNKLILKPGLTLPSGVDNYGMELTAARPEDSIRHP
jgi:hypothetical protein